MESRERNSLTEILDESAVSEIEAKTLTGHYPDLDQVRALCATVKHLLTELERGSLCEECDQWEYNEDGSCRTFTVCGTCWNNAQSQLEQLRAELAEEKRLRSELKQIAQIGISEVSSLGATLKDNALIDFRSRVIQICKDKAADYERAMRNRQTREAFTKTYQDAANEIREALEAQ